MIKNFFNKLGKTKAGPGQSLVEVAIAAPLLIFMLIGVFEVGWALRGYLVLVNVNREITRFAVRPGYMDFSTQEKISESFDKVRDWVDTSLGEQLNLDFDPDTGNATLIISHMVINTGQPCEDTLSNQCDCSQVTDDSYNKLFTEDDFFIHPGMPGYEYQTRTYGPIVTTTTTRTTRVDYEAEINNNLKPWNNELNCQIIKKGGLASDNNIIITELFFDQPQLFGFPLISNPITDPVPLYTRTSMRLVGASRGNLTQNINTIGPICIAYPFTVRDINVPAEPSEVPFDIIDGASNHGLSATGNDDRGFLAWDPDANLDVFTLQDEINYPQMSINSYTNANDPNDKTLSIGDYVHTLPGNNGGVNDTNYPLLDNIVGQEIIIPVWDSYDSGSQAYHIKRFIRVRMTAKAPDGISLTGNDPFIMAVYLGPAENCN